jgi:hypothetical protein
MDPKDFCNWFKGILDFNKAGDGSIFFDTNQVSKIEEKLGEALKPRPSGRPPRPDLVRC